MDFFNHYKGMSGLVPQDRYSLPRAIVMTKIFTHAQPDLQEKIAELRENDGLWMDAVTRLLRETWIDIRDYRIVGCLIVFCLIRWPLKPSLSLLANRFLVYVGDISYVMYLIHWPVIVMVKYIQGHQTLDVYTTFILFAVILLLSVAFHHSLEKCILASSLTVNFIICAFCLGSIFASFPYYDVYSPHGQNVTNAIEWNAAQDAHPILPCKPDTMTEKWTNFTAEPGFRCEGEGNGTLKVLVIGNSMAWRAFTTIEYLFKGKYKTIRMFAKSSLPPISDVDPVFTEATHIVVDHIRPDILWSLHGDPRPQFTDPFVNKTTDAMFLSFQRNIDYYSQRSKVFIIDLPYFWERGGMAQEFRKRLKTGKSLDDLRIAKNDTLAQQFHHRNRILAVKCNNCLINDVQPRLYEGEWYYLYNRKNLHEYTLDGFHFTSEMFEKLMPTYKAVAEKALAMVGG